MGSRSSRKKNSIMTSVNRIERMNHYGCALRMRQGHRVGSSPAKSATSSRILDNLASVPRALRALEAGAVTIDEAKPVCPDDSSESTRYYRKEFPIYRFSFNTLGKNNISHFMTILFGVTVASFSAALDIKCRVGQLRWQCTACRLNPPK
jgi:hypothetical protein